MKLIENYKNDEQLRNAYHQIIAEIFPSISFKKWYKLGFWNENYIQYSFYDGEKIISSASVFFIDLIVNGNKQKGAQIGAVGTLPEYRNNGYSRKLMEVILDKHYSEVEVFFLYANESVLNFYPKFGFKPQKEKLFMNSNFSFESESKLKKLNLDNSDDFTLIKTLLEKRIPISKIFGADKYSDITMWHLLNIHSNNLYYIKEEECIIIKEEDKDELHIYEVICQNKINLQNIISKVAENEKTRTVIYYFPNDQLEFSYNKTIDADSGLFVLCKSDFSQGDFKFPETAIT